MKILALHGFTGCGADFDSLKALTKDKGYHWYCPDLPGHGQSTSPSDLNSILQELDYTVDRIGEPVLLLGYSMGGRIALQYALRNVRKLNGLILVGTTAGIEDEKDRLARLQRDHAMADHIENVGIKVFLDEWRSNPLIKTQDSITDDVRLPMIENRLNLNPQALAQNLRSLGTGSLDPIWDQLQNIHCPAKVLAGEFDLKFVKIGQKLAQSLPNASFSVVPGVGHCAHLENSHFFLAELENMVEKLTSTATL